MSSTLVSFQHSSLSVTVSAGAGAWAAVGEGPVFNQQLRQLLPGTEGLQVTVFQSGPSSEILELSSQYPNLQVRTSPYDAVDFDSYRFLIVSTGTSILDEKIGAEAQGKGLLVSIPGNAALSDFQLTTKLPPVPLAIKKLDATGEQSWKRITTLLIFAFIFMVVGHVIISNLSLPGVQEIISGASPYFNRQFLFFILAGFLAQMVDGVLSMGYGVTSATCLMTFGVNPVAMSAAIHTSEIFTTGISGYSHYKFGNVNKKLFRHLVIPGVIGAVAGALLLVFLGEQSSKWLMPAIAVYAGFLGIKILIKAFGGANPPKKVKRIGWLAGAGGFLDSFGGGGWGPIVTSSLIAKGRSPKYTIGSVSLTEFFVTLSSAFTFFLTVGVSHWNIVLGLLIGGGIAAPIAARLAGKLPRKTMMIAVGIMVMIWCIRMFLKSVL